MWATLRTAFFSLPGVTCVMIALVGAGGSTRDLGLAALIVCSSLVAGTSDCILRSFTTSRLNRFAKGDS